MNYMPKALILGESLKKYNPEVKFYVILLEREIPKEVDQNMYKIIDKIILAKDLGYENFDKFIFKHSIVEAATSVKGQALVYLLENESDKVIYLDPDIKVFDKLTKLDNLLNENEIILTPHLTIPEESEIDIQNNELCALMHGVYNLGFLAVRNGSEGLRFAKWWRDRLHLYCYDNIPNGIFTDQRWIDLAPAMFDVYILKDTGHNMAPWNLSKRSLSKNNNKLIVNNKDDLVFFHFSGFDSGANLGVFSYYVKNNDAVEYEIRNEYISDLERMKQDELGDYPWSYSKYFSDEVVDRNIRIKYRDAKYFNTIENSPFEMSNVYFNNIFNMKNITKLNLVKKIYIKAKKIIKKLIKKIIK